jgi:hypothetical protein
MPILQVNLAPSRKELRLFAGLWWPAMCAVIGLMLLRKLQAPGTAVWVWVGGSLSAIAGLVVPVAIKPIYIALVWITYPIGFCVSHLVLAVLYFLILTPIGVLVRWFHDPMERKFDRAIASYWVAREEAETDRYFRQM